MLKLLPNAQIIELHNAVKAGSFPTKIVEQFIDSGETVHECEVLDFKKIVPSSDAEYVKAMRDAVALHNSYGGFVVFGVAEVQKDKQFRLEGVGTASINLQKIRDLARTYCGTDIRMHSAAIDVRGLTIEVLCVSKRSLGEPPVRFQKNGPDDKPGKPAFKRDDVVFRRIDANAIASSPDDYDFLFSLRKPPSLELGLIDFVDRAEPISHNLPDRTLICSRFVGRSTSLGALWSWIADDFSRVRLIAGEGGLGKTSLAYRFCEEIVTRRVKPYTTVLWLSAKKRQFIPSSDSYREAPQVDYESAETLFRAVCLELGCFEADLDGLDSRRLMKLALDTFATIPAFVVVDDVDSLTPDDQKSVLEFGLRAPHTSKLLLTTRVNFSYADENVLKLDGLQGEDFVDYVKVLRNRYELPEASGKQITRLHDATGGSPLFTDSLLRLERRGQGLDSAIGQWRGEKGVEARKAALLREVQQLGKQAKRVLYVVSVLKNTSYTELAQIVNYADQTLGDALQELASLFLISAPAIAKEARYTVEPNTGALVLEIATTLGIDHTALLQEAKRDRIDAVGLSMTKRNDLVGQAITQAMAQLKAHDPKSALDGVVDVSKKMKRQHPDLLLMMGRCYLKQSPPNFTDASKAFELAYGLGQRKSLLFELWFEADYGRGDLDGVLTLVDTALEQPGLELVDWYERRAQVRVERVQRRTRASSSDSLHRELDEAIRDLKSAARHARFETEVGRIQRLISQARAVKASFLSREAALSAPGFKALDDLLDLLNGSANDPEVIAEYFQAVGVVTNSAILKYVGKPKGTERAELEKHLRNAKAIGGELINKGLPYRPRETFHSMSQVIDKYLQKREI